MKRKQTEPVDFYGPWPFGLPTKTPWMCHWNEPSRNGISIWGLRTSVSVRQTRDGGWPVWWSTWNKEEMQPTVEIRDPGQDVQGSQIASKRIGGAGALIFLVELRKMWTLQSDCTTWFAISLRVVCGGVFVLVQYPECGWYEHLIIQCVWQLYLKTSMQSMYINVLWRDCECMACKSSSDSGPHVLSQDILQKCDPETR